MRWYRFGDSTAWLKNGPANSNAWKAFVAGLEPGCNYCFVYEDQTLIAVIDCFEWLKTSKGNAEDHFRNLTHHLQTELDKTMFKEHYKRYPFLKK